MAGGTLIVRFLGDTTALTAACASASASVSSVGAAMTTGLTVPLAAVGGASVAAFSQFESSMGKIQGLVGLSSGEVSKFSNILLNEGPKWGQSPRDLAEALYFVTSSGFKGKEALEILKLSAQGASVGLGEVTTLADLLTSAMNAYGPSNLSASKAMDILTVATREGKLEANDMAEQMGQVMPIAAELGIGFDEVAAAMASMSLTGTDAATGASNLRNIMTDLVHPTAEAEKTLKGLGTSSAELRDLFKEDFMKGMTKLDEIFKNDPEAMGKVFGDVRSLTGFLSMMGEQTEDTKRIFGETEKASGDFAEALSVAEKTSMFKFKVAMAEMEAALIKFGAAIAPTATLIASVLADAIGLLASIFSSLPQPIQTAIVLFGLLVMAAGPLIWIFGQVVVALGLLKTAFMLVTTNAMRAWLVMMGKAALEMMKSVVLAAKTVILWIGRMIAKMATTVALWVAHWARMAATALASAARIALAWIIAMGPIGWVIALILALIAIDIWAWMEKGDPFWVWKKIWQGLFDILMWFLDLWIDFWKNVWSWVIDLIQQGWDWLKNIFVMGINDLLAAFPFLRGLVQIISDIWDAVVAVFQWAVDFIGGLISTVVQWIIDNWWKIEQVAQFTWDLFQQIWDTIWNFISGIASFIGDHIQRIKDWWATLWEVVQTVWDVCQAIWNTIWNIISGIVSFIGDHIQRIKDFWGSLWEVVQTVWDICQAIWNTIWSIISGIVSFIGDHIQRIKDFWGSLWEVVQTIWDIMQSVWNTIWNAISGIVSFIGDHIQRIKDFWGSLWEIVQTIWDIMQSVWNTIWGKVQEVVQAISDGVQRAKDAFNRIWDMVQTARDAIAGVVSAVADKIGEIASTVGNGVRTAVDTVRNLASDFYNAGAQIVSRMAEGVKSMAGKVIGEVKDMLDKAKGLLPGSPPKWGPISGYHDPIRSGGRISERIAAGIRHRMPMVLKSMEDVIDATRLGDVFVAGGSNPSLTTGMAARASRNGNQQVSVNLTIDSAGSRFDDLIVQAVSKAMKNNPSFRRQVRESTK